MAVVAVALSIACESDADRRRQAEVVVAELQAQQRAEEAAQRSRVLQSPDEFLRTSDLQVFDRGIINSYRQLTSVTVLNSSKYPLNNLRGEVDWLAEDGTKFGSVPFTLKGSIPAGDTKLFSQATDTLANGALQGAAKRARLRFTSVEIVGSPAD